jgi:hypothetical protein
MQNNWNIKRLVKQFVMSATYQQSAEISKEKLALDPENILLARGPRFRVAAELIRDIVLSSSGLLNDDIGGPSVKPYQPAGLWEGATSGRGLLSVYKQDHGKDIYRRGMYTLVKRTVPPASMSIFDASNRDICEVKRQRTNTPLQALVMMNDPTVLEASRVLAGKLFQENKNINVAIAKAFRLIVCRNPNDKELAILTNYYSQQESEIKILSAQKMLAIGEYPILENVDKKKLAALMRVIATIYNLEETITKT